MMQKLSMTLSGKDTSLSDELLNSETLEAMAEVQAMIDSGTGEHFEGSTADFLTMLSEG